MCEWNKYGDTRIDPCLRNLIAYLNNLDVTTLACCCGHGKYPLSIIVLQDGKPYDICSDIFMTNKKRFYKRDAEGYYYLPDVNPYREAFEIAFKRKK